MPPAATAVPADAAGDGEWAPAAAFALWNTAHHVAGVSIRGTPAACCPVLLCSTDGAAPAPPAQAPAAGFPRLAQRKKRRPGRGRGWSSTR
eukprot:gene48249-7330_t